jgi:hypothetical protein
MTITLYYVSKQPILAKWTTEVVYANMTCGATFLSLRYRSIDAYDGQSRKIIINLVQH